MIMNETLHTPAALPADEQQRLQVLIDLNLLDTPPDERFDRIRGCAARVFGVPVAVVSLVDGERQWFKSRVGIAGPDGALGLVLRPRHPCRTMLMVVVDARHDERFANSPMVRGEAGGALLCRLADRGARRRPGSAALCLIDRVPREFQRGRRATAARDLAGIVANEVAALELKATVERERKSAAAVRALLEHLPEGVLMLDQDGIVISCNPAAEGMFGAPCKVLAGLPSAELIGMQPKAVARHEGNGRRADGSSFAAEVSIAEMQLDGKVFLVATVRDVAWHRAEQERVRAANQRRHDYFRTASHELRTPMASILGFSELLLKREFDAATGRELIDIIHRQATRLIGLVDQMLDLARIDAGGAAQLHSAPLDLAEVLGKVVAAVEAPSDAARIALDAAPGQAQVVADPLRVQQALANILANALAYSAPDSQVALGLAPASREGRPGFAVVVRDQGVGMTPEQRRQVYDAFWRAGSLPDVPGNGLGMTIVREIVHVHCGTIEIASNPGDGTTVTLWLPLEPASEAGA